MSETKWYLRDTGEPSPFFWRPMERKEAASLLQTQMLFSFPMPEWRGLIGSAIVEEAPKIKVKTWLMCTAQVKEMNRLMVRAIRTKKTRDINRALRKVKRFIYWE